MGVILILSLIILPMLVLIFDINTNSKKWKKSIHNFNKTKKEIDHIDISDYKIGSGHMYNNY